MTCAFDEVVPETDKSWKMFLHGGSFGTCIIKKYPKIWHWNLEHWVAHKFLAPLNIFF